MTDQNPDRENPFITIHESNSPEKIQKAKLEVIKNQHALMEARMNLKISNQNVILGATGMILGTGAAVLGAREGNLPIVMGGLSSTTVGLALLTAEIRGREALENYNFLIGYLQTFIDHANSRRDETDDSQNKREP